tara:strand:+ start:131 stop:475 length:345 start_codon:yes stop_codon:yes gene_type:complete
MGAILSKFSDKVEYYFYEIKNKNNKTMYVGKSKNFNRRKKGHNQMFLGDTIKIIMNVYCNEEWSKKIEQAWISLLSPTRNENRANNFKNGTYYLPPYYEWKRRGFSDEVIKKYL